MDTSSQDPSSSAAPSAIREWLGTVALYAVARLQLLQLEAREAGSRSLSLLLLAVLALGVLGSGWLIAVPALVWLAAETFSIPWHIAALAAAALHILVGGLLLALLKRKIAGLKLFEDTVNELQKDRQWLSPKQP
jgi:uncharacterized membrane protein YqjE